MGIFAGTVDVLATNQNYNQHEYTYAPVKSMNNVTYNIPWQAGDREINHQQVERDTSHIGPWWQTNLTGYIY